MDCPQVPLDFMNQDHAKFIVQRDKLLGLIYSYAPNDILDSALDELLEETRQHFAEENRQMIEKHFPPYLTHESEHERTLLDMTAHISDWKQNRDSDMLQNWLKVTLADWLINHINTMDFVSAWFISEQQ